MTMQTLLLKMPIETPLTTKLMVKACNDIGIQPARIFPARVLECLDCQTNVWTRYVQAAFSEEVMD